MTRMDELERILEPFNVLKSMRLGLSTDIIKAHNELLEIIRELLAACKRQSYNIERWIDTGTPAGPEESEQIYNQLKAAIAKAEGVTK